ncbi:MAG: hypothetical protein ACE141_04375 [Bryobacteraceae bacterium]
MAQRSKGSYVPVQRPALTVDWKWPLRVAVMPDEGYQVTQSALSELLAHGPAGASQLLQQVRAPADEAGSSDVLIFPRGASAWETLLASKAPLTAGLLVLCGVRRTFDARRVGELLALARARAVLLVELSSSELGWLVELIAHLSRGAPLDAAVSQVRQLGFAVALAWERPPSHRRPERKGAVPARAGRRAAAKAPAGKPEPRFLQERLKALEPATVAPARALEAGREYSLEVRIGPKEKTWTSAREAFPLPAVTPAEAAVPLLVVFEERNSIPAPLQQTILLPRRGVSSTCLFEFTVSPAARLFEGWISVYHNNRLIQEARLRSAVLGGGGEVPPEGLPKQTTFELGWMPRPLELGLEGRRIYAGTARFDAEGLTAVRGFQTSRVTLPGVKEAVAAIETEFNRIRWEDLPADWTADESAVAGVRKVALNGWQIHQALIQDPVARKIAESTEPVLVYATDSQVRMPLEFCYARSQPKRTAKICPMSAASIRNGHCSEPCMEKQHPGDYLCPFGFWGMTRVIEWRNRVSDERPLDADSIEVTNEPSADRRSLAPLASVLVARSGRVEPKDLKGLREVLRLKAVKVKEVRNWDEWTAGVAERRPTLLVLLPHVDGGRRPPLVEIGLEEKDPPGVERRDVVGDPPQQPVVLLMGCGAAVSLVDFQNLPAQFRRQQAALVVAPVAELLAKDAPEVAKAVVQEMAEDPKGEKPFGEVLLKAKRRLLAEGKLAGLLLLAFGDADWKV